MKALTRTCPGKAALLAALVFVGAAAGQVLNVPQKNQEKNQWCWAASTQAILAYYGYAYSQATIAQYGTSGVNVPNYLYGEGYEDGVNKRGCNKILQYFGGIQSQSAASALSLSTSQNEIAGGRPILIRWGWTSGGGHILLIKGLSGSTASLMDPWYGPTVNTFSWVVSGGEHSWTHSLRLTTSPLWSGAVDLGGGWKWLNWFGYFAPTSGDWVWHKQFGFVVCTGTDASLWMWINDQGEWWWTTSTIFPNMYRARDNAWLFYQRDSNASVSDKRWFYNYNTNAWVWY